MRAAIVTIVLAFAAVGLIGGVDGVKTLLAIGLIGNGIWLIADWRHRRAAEQASQRRIRARLDELTRGARQ